MLCLASAILASGPGRGLQRAFAALLGLRGMTLLLPQASTDPDWLAAALHVQPYFVLASVPVALYCLLSTADESRSNRRAGVAAVLGIVALAAMYWADHTLFQTIVPGEAPSGALRAGEGLQYTAFGPLALVGAAVGPLLALLGVRFAMRYRQDPAAATAPTMLFVAAGLMLGGLFDGANRLAALVNLMDDGQGYPWTPWGWSIAVVPAFSVLPAILTAGLLAAERHIAPRPAHVAEGRLLVLALVAFFSGFLRLALPANSDPAGQVAVAILLGFWRLAMPVLVAYAFVRGPTLLGPWRGHEAFAWSFTVGVVAAAGLTATAIGGTFAKAPGPLALGLLAAVVVAAGARPLLVFGHRLMQPRRALPREGDWAKGEPKEAGIR